jgi:hypothetical protein
VELTYAEKLLKRQRLSVDAVEQVSSTTQMPQPVIQMPSAYCDLSNIPGTTCTVERLFSKAALLLSDLRTRLSSSFSFECLMMLHANRQHWGLHTVVEAMNRSTESTDRVVDEDDESDDEN